MTRSKGLKARARAEKARTRSAGYRQVCAAVDMRDGGTCRCCGAWAGEARHHHHIVFRSQRGADTLDNILVLCARCHESVHRHTLTITGNATTAVFTLGAARIQGQ